MKWTPDADKAVKKAPFFVRKRIRARVEKEAGERGKTLVTLADVRQTQARYLSGMEKEIEGYRIDGCFGPGGCPNRAIESDDLLEQIEAVLKSEDLLDFLKRRVGEKLKFHHEFRVTLSDCPNACSQPQIKDVGIVGACVPEITETPCDGCQSCAQACRENAVELKTGGKPPRLDRRLCLCCGQCVDQCPTGTVAAGRRGYRVLLGGKLGRHPRLARELPGIFTATEVLDIVKSCIEFYKNCSGHGERFAELLTDRDFETFSRRFAKKNHISEVDDEQG